MTATTCAPRPQAAGRFPLLALAALIALPLVGCYRGYSARVATTPVYGGYQTTAYPAQGTLVYQAPPPPRQVYAQPQPYAGAQWVDGHWEWNGAQYVWVDGYWVQGRPGYVYMQPRWERRGGGYVYVDGGWGGGGGGVVVQQPRPRGGTVYV
ncbi:MAG: YXWGXW repeat-containing protein [Deltaproteobacteria bacterium]|nr:YXWGXW repeat-containing protein [Deltaproteobacteria bacterium]